MARSRVKQQKTSKSKSSKKSKSWKKTRSEGSKQQLSKKNVEDFRDMLSRSVLSPLNLVMLTRDRIQEAVDDAVERGRITHTDAQDLVQILVKRGRKETNDVLSDLERLIGRGRDEIDMAAGSTRSRATLAAVSARKRVEKSTSRVKRVSGGRVALPMSGYEKLTATQVRKKIDGMDAKNLRKLKTYEGRNANRKSVLDAVERKLSKT